MFVLAALVAALFASCTSKAVEEAETTNDSTAVDTPGVKVVIDSTSSTTATK